jgi:pyruvate kinase
MDYDIIATLGPASETETVWQAMLAAGATGFRLNTSHLTLSQLNHWIDRLEVFFSNLGWHPYLALDLQGSKWRLGEFPAFVLEPGQRVDLICASSASQPQVLPVPHADFFQAAAVSSGEVVLNDAKIRLYVENAGSNSARARVLQGGEIAPRKGITFAASGYRVEALSEKDQAILEATRELASVQYAISYVKDAAEMRRYRELCGPQARLIAKIERRQAVDEAVAIAGSADALWLCRGDLGAELGLMAMAEAVHSFADLPVRLDCPVLMAGQVLEHMTTQPTPTRSEVCNLYDSLVHGYRGVVLSDEAAIGRYPVESCAAAALFHRSARPAP